MGPGAIVQTYVYVNASVKCKCKVLSCEVAREANIQHKTEQTRVADALATQMKAVQTAHCCDLSSVVAQRKSASGGMSQNSPGYAKENPQVATIPKLDTMKISVSGMSSSADTALQTHEQPHKQVASHGADCQA